MSNNDTKTDTNIECEFKCIYYTARHVAITLPKHTPPHFENTFSFLPLLKAILQVLFPVFTRCDLKKQGDCCC